MPGYTPFVDLLKKDVKPDDIYRIIRENIDVLKEKGIYRDTPDWVDKGVTGRDGVWSPLGPRTYPWLTTPKITIDPNFPGRYSGHASGYMPSTYYPYMTGDTKDKINLITAAHEMLEREEILKKINIHRAYTAGGGAAGAYVGATVPQATMSEDSMLRTPLSVAAAGALALAGLSAGFVLPIKSRKWSSHFGPQVLTREGQLISKLEGTTPASFFKDLRTVTGERAAMRKAIGQDYGYEAGPKDWSKMYNFKP